MVALLLVAVSLGLSNFAAAIGIGVSGVDARTRLRVGIVFGLFETVMPLLGLLLGHGLAHTLGHAARWNGAALLIVTGLDSLIQALRRNSDDAADRAGRGLGMLLISGLALSIDNLAVGFALGTYHVALLAAAVVIGAVRRHSHSGDCRSSSYAQPVHEGRGSETALGAGHARMSTCLAPCGPEDSHPVRAGRIRL